MKNNNLHIANYFLNNLIIALKPFCTRGVCHFFEIIVFFWIVVNSSYDTNIRFVCLPFFALKNLTNRG